MSNIGQNSGHYARNIEPTIRVNELDEFFHDFRAAVIQLEHAYRNDTLADLLQTTDLESRVGTAIFSTYRQLVRFQKLEDPAHRRQQTVYALLDQMRDELFGIDHWFHAEIEPLPPAELPPAEPVPTADLVQENFVPEESLSSENCSPELQPTNGQTPDTQNSNTTENSNTTDNSGTAENSGTTDNSDTENTEPVANTERVEDQQTSSPTQPSTPEQPLEQVADRSAPPPVSQTNPTEPDSAGSTSTEYQPLIGPKYLYRVHSGQECLVLRYDQLISARSWRIGFTFDKQAAIDELAARMARQAVQHLARDLHDLGKMLPRLLRYKHVDFPPLVPPRKGRDLEQLIADIVNEHQQHASLSRLSEDYSQKTDLRVKYPDLERTRGARVQVTMGASRESHTSKVKGIKRADHYVLVSPWTLANAVPHFSSEDESDTPDIQFDDDLIYRFWAAFPNQPSDIESLSLSLRRVFEAAIKKSHMDPRGPMAFVPEAIRQFIRVYIRSEAFRSTKVMRLWLEESGSITRTSDGRLALNQHVSQEVKEAVAAYYDQHPSGTTVKGTVLTVGANEARIQLDDKIRGRVSKYEISWRSDKADPSHFLSVNAQADFMVIPPHNYSNPRLVELSLRQLRPDPWSNGTIEQYQVGEIYPGKVQQQKNYGVFVEFTPDLVGLLHKSQLHPFDQEKLPDLYRPGSTLHVRILAIDPQRRSISLQPT